MNFNSKTNQSMKFNQTLKNLKKMKICIKRKHMTKISKMKLSIQKNKQIKNLKMNKFYLNKMNKKYKLLKLINNSKKLRIKLIDIIKSNLLIIKIPNRCKNIIQVNNLNLMEIKFQLLHMNLILILKMYLKLMKLNKFNSQNNKNFKSGISHKMNILNKNFKIQNGKRQLKK